jgi:phosphohistidine phosphatase SixA
VFFLTLSRFVERDEERRLEKRGIKKVMFSWRMMKKKKAILRKTRPTSDVKERR